MDWEPVETCNYCGNTEFREYLHSQKPNWYDSRPLILDECTNCHLVFANPRPDRYQLNKAYLTGTGNAEAAVERKLARKNVYAIHRKVIEDAALHLNRKPRGLFDLTRKPRRLYDMGCGAGSLMEEAIKMGLETWGNDINKAAVDRLNGLGAKALHGFTVDVQPPFDYFDIVTNLDYIEHTYEPIEDLKLCYDILVPGGVLYLKTLFLDCAAHIMNDDGWKLFGHGHFHFYWTRVLSDMIKSVGFELREVRIGHLISVIATKP